MTRQLVTNDDLSKERAQFAVAILGWYECHARKMPWRVTPHDHAAGVRAEPYHVWLSEVMLQQTQVATVHEYFIKFLSNWPTVQEMADAELEDILKAWAGLGYYSRARNLKKCADIIASEFGGKFPHNSEALKKLPGIGDYTAAAIASIAFDEPVAVLDGNIERVMTRQLRIEKPASDAKPEIRQALTEILDQEKPGEFAQAMMDLGATICTPKRPACSLCPVNSECQAFAKGDQERFPVKKSKPKKPTRKGAAFVIQNSKGDVFLTKRPQQGLLAGMTQVPTTGWSVRVDGATGKQAAPLKADWQNTGSIRHTFTHFHLELEVWHATHNSKISFDGWWCKFDNLENEALPTVMKKAISKALPSAFKA